MAKRKLFQRTVCNIDKIQEILKDNFKRKGNPKARNTETSTTNITKRSTKTKVQKQVFQKHKCNQKHQIQNIQKR